MPFEAHIDQSRNAVSLTHTLHQIFGSFQICLEATSLPHIYKVTREVHALPMPAPTGPFTGVERRSMVLQSQKTSDKWEQTPGSGGGSPFYREPDRELLAAQPNLVCPSGVPDMSTNRS